MAIQKKIKDAKHLPPITPWPKIGAVYHNTEHERRRRADNCGVSNFTFGVAGVVIGAALLAVYLLAIGVL